MIALNYIKAICRKERIYKMEKSKERIQLEPKLVALFDKLDTEGKQLALNNLKRLIMMRDGKYPEAKEIHGAFAARIANGEHISIEEFRAHDARMNTLLGIA